MPDCNLDLLEQRINISREEFLHASNEYDPNVARQIVREFVAIFLDEKETQWATTTQDLADQITKHNNRFTGVIASVASKVEIASLSFQQATLHLSVEVMRVAVEGVGQAVPMNSSPLEWLKQQQNKLNEVHRALVIAGESAQNRACRVGEQIDIVQRMATDILLLHIETLRAFKSRNLGIEFKDIVDRLRTEIKDYAKSEGSEEAVKIVLEKLHELLGIVVEQAPVIRVLKMAEKITKILGPKEVKPDSTNELNKLADLMKKENALYQSVDDAYQRLLDEVHEINRMDLTKAA